MLMYLQQKLVSDKVGIDMIAGPSEILILADQGADVTFIAADMIAQAEHDEKAMALVMTTSQTLVEPLLLAVEAMVKTIQGKPLSERPSGIGA